jgi:uncharacterized membrane protein YfbV (UPF0208 family)
VNVRQEIKRAIPFGERAVGKLSTECTKWYKNFGIEAKKGKVPVPMAPMQEVPGHKSHAEYLQKKGMGRENKCVDGIKSAARNC